MFCLVGRGGGRGGGGGGVELGGGMRELGCSGEVRLCLVLNYRHQSDSTPR